MLLLYVESIKIEVTENATNESLDTIPILINTSVFLIVTSENSLVIFPVIYIFEVSTF